MAIKCINANWSGYLNDYIKELVCDSDDDFANLPKCAPGSMALSPSGNIMMVNASDEWVAFGE